MRQAATTAPSPHVNENTAPSHTSNLDGIVYAGGWRATLGPARSVKTYSDADQARSAAATLAATSGLRVHLRKGKGGQWFAAINDPSDHPIALTGPYTTADEARHTIDTINNQLTRRHQQPTSPAGN